MISRAGAGQLGRRRLLAVLLVCAAFAAEAAEETPPPDGIGRSTFVVNEVDGQAGTMPAKRIAVDDDILFDEDITTGTEAKTIIQFRDGSTFEIGPDAVVRIDSFIFNPAESTSQKSLQVAHGIFRYVSGYVAGDQETKIATPAGALAIRGSVVSGIVDPAVPNFIYVGEGSATFSNPAGSSPLKPDEAIAVPSASTAPMPAAAMPAPVAAEALGVIERHLPPRQALDTRPPENEDRLRRQGAADLVPAAQQRQRQGALAGRPVPAPPAGRSLAGELGLLAEGSRVGLFRANPGPRTREQAAFLMRAARTNPNAAIAMRRFAGEARALHDQNREAGTRFVIRGVRGAGASPEVLRRVNEATIRANPAAAAQIRRESAGPVNRAQPPRPQRTRPQEVRPQQARPQQARPQQARPQQARPQQARPQQARPQQARPAQARPEPQNRREGMPPQQRQPQRRPRPKQDENDRDQR